MVKIVENADGVRPSYSFELSDEELEYLKGSDIAPEEANRMLSEVGYHAALEGSWTELEIAYASSDTPDLGIDAGRVYVGMTIAESAIRALTYNQAIANYQNVLKTHRDMTEDGGVGL